MQEQNLSPLFSVIIPIYNVEKYLPQCVDSVLKQDFKNYEIILVDDGSPDNCPHLCDEYAKKYPHIKVIHKENGGLSDARNFGIKAARGEYLIFLDSDDYWWDKDVFNTLEKIILDTKPDLIIHGHTNVYPTHKTVRNFKAPLVGDFYKDLPMLIKHNIYDTTGWNKIIKRNIIVENNIQFPVGLLHEDCSWCFDIASQIKKYVVLPISFYQYRLGRIGAITADIKPKNILDLFKILQDKFSLWNTYNDDMKYKLGSYLSILYQGICYKLFLLKDRNNYHEIYKLIYPFYKENKDILVRYSNTGRFGYIKIIFYRLFGFLNTTKIIFLLKNCKK